MGIYIYNLLSIPIYNKIIKDKKIFIILVSIQLFLILALRDISVGVDGNSYLEGYLFIKNLSFNDLISRLHIYKNATLVYPIDFESGYTVLNWIFGKLGCSYHQFMGVLSFFFILSFSVFVYRYSLKPWLSYIIFIGFGIYGYYFGINRQVLAMSIVLWTIPFIFKKKFLKFSFYMLIAFTMHKSAIVWFPLYFIGNYTITRKVYKKIIFGEMLIFILSPIIYYNIFAKVLRLFGEGHYINNTHFKIGTMFILLISIIFIILFFVNFKIFQNKINNIALMGFLCMVPLEITALYNEIVARIMLFYTIFLCILIPNIVATYLIRKNKKIDYRSTGITRFIFYVIIVILMLFNLIHTVKGSNMNPYIFHI